MLGAAGRTLFLAILAGGTMAWFRRIRVGANVDGNTNSGAVQMAVFSPHRQETKQRERLMPRCRYLMPLLLLLLLLFFCL